MWCVTIVTGDGIFIPPSYHQQTHPLFTKYNLLVTHLSLPQTYIYEKGISAMVIGQNFFKLKVKVKAYMSDIKAKVSKSMILRKNTEIGLEMREDMFRRTDTGHSILSLVPWSRQALGQEILHCGLLHVGAGGGLASSGETVGWSYKQDWYTGYWYSTGSVTPEVARRNMRINIAKIKGCERSWGKRWAILEGSYQDSQEKYNQGDR